MIQDKPERFEISDASKLYFTSDKHYFHKRICEFTDRKLFTTVEEHTEWLIKQCNDTVPASSENHAATVLHLGDMFFSCSNEDAVSVLKQLNGNWWFIVGNHDSVGKLNTVVNTVNEELGTNHRVLGWYYRLNVVEISQIKGQKDYKKLVILCHFPIESWDSMGYGSFMINGHMHGMTHDYHTDSPMRIIPNRMDVGIDAAYNVLGEHRPFTWDEIKVLLGKNRDE